MIVRYISALIQPLYKWAKYFQSRIVTKSTVDRENEAREKGKPIGKGGVGSDRREEEMKELRAMAFSLLPFTYSPR